MAAEVTRKDFLLDMFAQGLSPAQPDFSRYCAAWIGNRFPDADDSVVKNFVNNFTKTTRDKWKKKHRYIKANLLADDYFKTKISFAPRKSESTELPLPPPPAEPPTKGNAKTPISSHTPILP